MKHLKSVLYINFAPYDNAGKILDYLLTRYEYVYHFSFNFHYLHNAENDSSLVIYKHRVIISRQSIFQLLPHPGLIFLLLPIRSIIFLLEIIRYSKTINKRYGEIDDYFTVNAYTAWCGLILKRLHFVKRTIFWVWDYYPPHDKSKVVTFMRWLYWHFDKRATHSDRLIFLNHRLENLRKKNGILPASKRYPIIGIGTNLIQMKRKISDSLLFIGVLKHSQGLELLIRNSDKLHRAYPKLDVHIIGTGPEENYLKSIATQSSVPFYFHGIQDVFSTTAKNIIKKTSIGIAPYKPEAGNVSYYGDPSKIKNYIGYGLPVITTNVFEFAKEIRNSHAGIVIQYDINAFIRALNTIYKTYGEYAENAHNLAKKYDYRTNYADMFEDNEG